MHSSRLTAAISISILASLGSTVAAQQAPSQDPTAIRAQPGESAERQTPNTDFGAVLKKGVGAASQERTDGLGAAIASLDELISSPRPAGLSRAEVAAWNEHTAWLTSVRNRYQALHGAYTAAGMDVGQAESGSAAPFVPGGAVVSAAVSGARTPDQSVAMSGGSPGENSAGARPGDAAMTQQDAEFLALQQAVQAEGRQFQSLSNASKARHDTAMNSIRNIK